MSRTMHQGRAVHHVSALHFGKVSLAMARSRVMHACVALAQLLLYTSPSRAHVQVSLEASTCTNHLLDPAFGGVYASEEQAPRTRIPAPEELHCHPMHPGCNP